MPTRPIAFLNARLVDPASGYDGPGALMTSQGLIAEVTHEVGFADLSPDIRRVDCNGAMLAPGLIDLRVKTGEPGAEPKETLKSAARAAAAGGVTSIVVQPDTDPAVDDPSVVDFILRRARDIELVHVYPAGAATKGLAGKAMAEIGLMREAGCVYVTDADRPIVDSKVFRRLLAYAGGLGPAGGAQAGRSLAQRRRGGHRGRVRRAHGPAGGERPGRADHAGAGRGAGRAHRRAAAGGPDQHRLRPGDPGAAPRPRAWP